jgi:hypothetical protein
LVPVNKRASQSDLERKIYLVAKEIGLERSERIELARYLLRRDVSSWTELDPAQVCRIADALEGFQLITELIRQRPLGDLP